MLSHINVINSVDCTIRELVETVVKVTGFIGDIEFDISKPDGAPRKQNKCCSLNRTCLAA